MPEPMHADEFDALRQLDVVGARPGAEIRHLGDRRRRTRTAFVTGGAAAVVAALIATSVWAGGNAGSPSPAPVDPATSPTGSPTGAIDPPLSTSALLPPEQVAAPTLVDGLELSPWSVRDTQPTLDCQPEADSLARLGAEDSVAQTLGLRALGVGATTDYARFNQSVLSFADDAAAEQAMATVAGWVADCAAPHGGQKVFPEDKGTLDTGGADVEADWGAWNYGAPESCAGACDASWSVREVVGRSGDRLVVWSLRVPGGPVEERIEDVMNAIAPAAFARALGGAAPATDSADTSASQVVAVPADFPLLAGLPHRAATEDFGRYGPDRDGDLLTLSACGTDLATPEPVDALFGGWRDPAEARQRELMLYSSVSEAQAFVDAVEQASSCEETEDGDGVTRIVSGAGSDLGLGDQAVIVVLWNRVDGAPAPGFRVTELVRVGNAVLVSDRIADGLDDPVTSAYLEKIIAESDQSLVEPVAALCDLSSDGC